MDLLKEEVKVDVVDDGNYKKHLMDGNIDDYCKTHCWNDIVDLVADGSHDYFDSSIGLSEVQVLL